MIYVYRFVYPGAVDYHQSSIQGRGINLHVTACTAARITVIARDRWGNVQSHPERVLGIVAGGGAVNGSVPSLQETVMVSLLWSLIKLPV
mmetsp:Transcript_16692/g.50540  ORF Transcript_16692/g.50540 Transcript_16692/m.50540 type:complete len:90 (+) Transcript_16692:3824-4093(+)